MGRKGMSKTFAVVLALIMMLSFCSVSAFAETSEMAKSNEPAAEATETNGSQAAQATGSSSVQVSEAAKSNESEAGASGSAEANESAPSLESGTNGTDSGANPTEQASGSESNSTSVKSIDDEQGADTVSTTSISGTVYWVNANHQS